MHTLLCTTITNKIYFLFFNNSIVTIQQKLIMAYYKIFISELELLLELEFELINSTSGSNFVARHLNFLLPSQVRAPLLDLSYSPYYPEVQTACSGATAAPGAGTTISNTPHLAMLMLTMNCLLLQFPQSVSSNGHTHN